MQTDCVSKRHDLLDLPTVTAERKDLEQIESNRAFVRVDGEEVEVQEADVVCAAYGLGTHLQGSASFLTEISVSSP